MVLFYRVQVLEGEENQPLMTNKQTILSWKSGKIIQDDVKKYRDKNEIFPDNINEIVNDEENDENIILEQNEEQEK